MEIELNLGRAILSVRMPKDFLHAESENLIRSLMLRRLSIPNLVTGRNIAIQNIVSRFCIFFVLICLISLRTYAADTTFGQTRAIPRSGQDKVYAGNIDLDSDDRSREEEPYQTFFDGCMSGDHLDSFGELLGYFATLPLRLGFCAVLDRFQQSHVDLFTGDADMAALRSRAWRFGFGFGFGAQWMPEAAGGMPFRLNLEVQQSLSPALQMRLRAGTFGSLMQPLVDYQRDILVNGKSLGIQEDHLTSYSHSGYPLSVEGLWTGSHGLYLAMGGGAAYLWERIGYVRMTNGDIEADTAFDSHHLWRPTASLAIGRFASRNGGRRFQRFEIRYQAVLLLPHRHASYPMDNALMSHSLTWDWGWMW